MIRQFQHATQLKPHELSILQNMSNFVKKYCPEEHLFELMFDANKNINCQRLIHRVVGAESFENYMYYLGNISQPFQELIEEDWIKLSQVIADLKIDELVAATVAHLQEPMEESEEEPAKQPEYFYLIIKKSKNIFDILVRSLV